MTFWLGSWHGKYVCRKPLVSGSDSVNPTLSKIQKTERRDNDVLRITYQRRRLSKNWLVFIRLMCCWPSQTWYNVFQSVFQPRHFNYLMIYLFYDSILFFYNWTCSHKRLYILLISLCWLLPPYTGKLSFLWNIFVSFSTWSNLERGELVSFLLCFMLCGKKLQGASGGLHSNVCTQSLLLITKDCVFTYERTLGKNDYDCYVGKKKSKKQM